MAHVTVIGVGGQIMFPYKMELQFDLIGGIAQDDEEQRGILFYNGESFLCNESYSTLSKIWDKLEKDSAHPQKG